MLYLRSYIPPNYVLSSVHAAANRQQPPSSASPQGASLPFPETDDAMPQAHNPQLAAKTAPAPSTQAVRAVNRMFADTVRNDWVFPPKDLSAVRSSTGAVGNVPSLGSRINPFLEAKDADPVTYRERFYSTSDDEELSAALEEEETEEDEEDESEDEEEEENEEGKDLESDEKKLKMSLSSTAAIDSQNGVSQAVTTPKRKRKSARFETPDSVADYVDKRLQAIKRRKRRLLEDEIQWNEGLCFFQKRRNAWTGAVSPEEAKSNMEAKETFTLSSAEMEAVSMSGLSLGYAPSPHPTPSSEEPPPPYPEHLLNNAGESSSYGNTDLKRTREEEEAANSPFKPPVDISTLTNVLIPISSPILPDSHPVRANILSRTDQELYEKLVRDSRTPAVPINLAHMMRVIVQGWKDEGNWPPRGAVPESSIAVGKRARGISSSVIPDGSLIDNYASMGKDVGASNSGKGFMANHPHLKQGVESFKRVLRISSGGGSGIERAGTPNASAGDVAGRTNTPAENKSRRSISQSKNSFDTESAVKGT